MKRVSSKQIARNEIPATRTEPCGGAQRSARPTCPRRLAVASAVMFCALAVAGRTAAAEPALTLGHGENSLKLTTNGAFLSWGPKLKPRGERQMVEASAGVIRYGTNVLKLISPAAVIHESGAVAFTYRWPQVPRLEFAVRHQLSRSGRASTWSRQIELRSTSPLTSDLTVSLDTGLGELPAETWLPRIDGVGAILGTSRTAGYRFAGSMPETPATLLALPMVSIPAPQGGRRRVEFAVDPYFSVLFTPASLEWTYPVRVGLQNGRETRTVVVSRHQGTPDDAVNLFFRTVLPDVPPGPKWLHEIALVDYDYLSDGGQGWYHDIDALSGALSKRERRQALLCLHGWYDFLGRYCFDAATGKLDREWTSFSSYELAKNKPAWGTIGGTKVPVGFGNCKPVKMSLAAVHERLKYARARGFRVAMYFADGVNAGEGLPDFEPSRVLRWGGWQGPDSKGRSYFQNPLHPKVHDFFVAYTRALLEEFGPEVDALNWDETFHIGPGDLGSDAFPGYADRAMMRLVRAVSQTVEDYNRKHHRRIAFLTSDCLGAFGHERKAPYALVAHGTYQDSWCQPAAWSCGIFANYRNVLWSCCWWPISKWPWIDFGVRQFQAPVSLSNGWGDDAGFSEMTPEQRARALALFNWRKGHVTRLRYFDRLPAF